MSQDGDKHGVEWKKHIKRWSYAFFITGINAIVATLVVRKILNPKEPSFILQDATIYGFNVSAANLLTTTIQVTITSRNPNGNLGIYYDNLHVYATYRGQQITMPSLIPPAYQGHKEVITWSPFIFATSLPVAPYNAIALSQDQTHGPISLILKIDGRLRWKIATIMSLRYHIRVKCLASIPSGSSSIPGTVVGNAVKYQLDSTCSVNVGR